MHKDPFVINLLLDMYESLLTDKQRTIMQLHYREDLSLAEISEELSISRAGVLDHCLLYTSRQRDPSQRTGTVLS